MSRRWWLALWIGFSGCGDDGSSGSGGTSSTSAGGEATSTTQSSASTGGTSTGGAGAGGSTGATGGGGFGGFGGGGHGGFGGLGGSNVGGASVGGAGGSNVGGASVGGANVGGAGGASVGGASVGGASVGGGGGAGGASTGTRVRIAASNLSTGNFQNYDGGEGIRILQGVDPDIILVQEMNYLGNVATALTSFTTQICGASCVYVRGPMAQIPNGIVSRYPIIASGSIVDPGVTDRTFVWAHIDVPGDRDLWAMSVHLRTANPAARDTEAVVVRDFFLGIPTGDLAVLGGDFNTDVRTEPALVTLSAVFRTSAPYPTDPNGNGMTSAPRTKPYDWVLADSDLDALEVPVILGSRVSVGGMVIDTRIHTPLTDLSPALMNDSGAPSMQHMLVVKDYVLP